MPQRRFPPPWSVEEPDPKLARQWCYIVRDANGHALAYVYFKGEAIGNAASADRRQKPFLIAAVLARVF